jgi:hypothetical protein
MSDLTPAGTAWLQSLFMLCDGYNRRLSEQVTVIEGFHALAADPAAALTDEQRLAYAGQARAVAEIAAIEADTHWRALTLICGPGNGP